MGRDVPAALADRWWVLMAASPAGELQMPVNGTRGGAMYAPELQRGRLLSATFAVVGEQGYEGMTARSVSEHAGVSNRTFYECFSDREDCFLAAFNHAVDGLELEARAGWDSQLGWTARVRGALAALLMVLDREPAVARLVIVEALSAGPRVLARRAGVLESLAGVVDQGRANAQAPKVLPALVAEGVVGATFGVIHARLLKLRPAPLIDLLRELMATIVLPYRGSTAAAKELEQPIPRPGRRGASRSGLNGPAHPAWRATHASERLSPNGGGHRDAPPIAVLDYRLTVRTQMALAAVSGRPGLSNREVSEVIGLSDQGQISRMLKRLQTQGLIENAQGQSHRQARAWRLTRDGEAVIDAHRGGRALIKAQRKAGKGGRLATTRSSAGRRSKNPQIAAAGTDRPRTALRMTALTREVLTVVAELSRWGANPTNRKIATAVKVKDEGQISKLLARLERHGLIENTGGPPRGANAWQLTPRGEQLASLSPDRGRAPAGGVRR
jgi:AcrR family transcriptional regulator/DNA-binding MarR family transcriptional regulator